MVRCADGTGPRACDEERAKAYAVAINIEIEFLHDQFLLEILCHYSCGAALDLGVGTGRYTT